MDRERPGWVARALAEGAWLRRGSQGVGADGSAVVCNASTPWRRRIDPEGRRVVGTRLVRKPPSLRHGGNRPRVQRGEVHLWLDPQLGCRGAVRLLTALAAGTARCSTRGAALGAAATAARHLATGADGRRTVLAAAAGTRSRIARGTGGTRGAEARRVPAPGAVLRGDAAADRQQGERQRQYQHERAAIHDGLYIAISTKSASGRTSTGTRRAAAVSPTAAEPTATLASRGQRPARHFVLAALDHSTRSTAVSPNTCRTSSPRAGAYQITITRSR